MVKKKEKPSLAKIASKVINDPIYFIEQFLWIVDKSREKVQFLLNEIQRRYVSEMTNNDLILKFRKPGFSSIIEALFLVKCLFVENTNAVTMAHTWDDTAVHMDRVKYFLMTMGKPGIKVDVPLDKENQRELYFPHTNSRYWIGTAGSTGFGRGRDVTDLHLTELAYYPSPQVVTSVLEACVPGARKIIETTGNGAGGLFYRLWKEATTLGYDGPWKGHFYGWHNDRLNVAEAPVNYSFSRDELAMKDKFNLKPNQVYWYHQKWSEMVDKTLMPQEFPSDAKEAFLTSGKCIFDRDGMDAQEQLIEKPRWVGLLQDNGSTIDFVLDPNERLTIYQAPEDNRSYLITADVAKGVKGGDYSVAGVWDRRTRALVAKWYGRCEPMDFGRIIFGLGLYYNTAMIAVETWPGPGEVTEAKLKDMGYRNLYQRAHFSGNGQEHEEGKEDGWVTDVNSRHEAIAVLMDSIRRKNIILVDRGIVDEFYNFIRHESGKMKARADCFDDQVIMCAMAAHIMANDSVPRSPGMNNSQDDREIIAVSMISGLGREKRRLGPHMRRRLGV